ncbi:MAG: ABC transporter ATP-binding protein [Bacteroidia bacterium]|nr:ABC transporter ATP-binding protein [Bacteroidia bacterium]
MIHLQNVNKVYRTQTVETLALNNISLEVAEGEFVSVMGPSGCGKSTMLHIMGLLDAPSSGSVTLDSQDLSTYTNHRLAKFRNENLGFIFQSFHLINDLAVVDNVELPLIYRRQGLSARRKSLAEDALEQVGLRHRTQHRPSQLSGGQKQRVAIARAIVGKPRIILADEPTGNLDSVMGQEIMDILLRLNKESRTTIVMVTHDENIARQTHRIVRLFDGSQVM